MVGLSRSTYYAAPNREESAENLALMRLIDRLYTARPFFGSPRITDWVNRLGFHYNHKRIERLMQVMGLAATVPGPHTSAAHPHHPIYPYLLRGVTVCRPDQVWCADITYIPVDPGYQFLVAIMDWYSRYVLAWELSNTLDLPFCLEALDHALVSAQPEIFNTDQGSQFTSAEWIGRLQGRQIAISMDGRGRAMDNIFVERLWRTVKYEDIYLHDYCGGAELRLGVKRYFRFYNEERRHSALGKRTPAEVYGSRTLPGRRDRLGH